MSLAKLWNRVDRQYTSERLNQFLTQIPDGPRKIEEIFKEFEGKEGGSYVLSSKLPWHFITRPDIVMWISYFQDLMEVKFESDGYKDVSFTFDRHTGYLVDSERQIFTMWPVTSLAEIESNIKYAHNNAVRYGIKQKK